MTGSSQNSFNEVLLALSSLELLCPRPLPKRPSIPASIRGSAALSVTSASLGQSAVQTAAVMRAGRPPVRSASVASARSTFSRKMRMSASCTCAITARAAAEAARGAAAARWQGVKAWGGRNEFFVLPAHTHSCAYCLYTVLLRPRQAQILLQEALRRRPEMQR